MSDMSFISGKQQGNSTTLYNYWLHLGTGHESLSPEKKGYHRGCKAEVNITFKGI